MALVIGKTNRAVVARAATLITFAAIGGLSTVSNAQTIDPFYSGNYTYTDLGSVPGLPSQYGGLTFKYHDPTTIYIGGAANTAAGMIYSITVVRGQGNHITGFSGMATPVIQGAYNDGGVAYGPSGVLFLARWPVNELGQTKLGSGATDKIVMLGPLNIVASPGGLNFVPKGMANEGKLKMVSWAGGQFYDVGLAADNTGTFDITSATLTATLTGGPEGFLYVPKGSPLFPDGSIVVSEYSAGSVGTYETDANGDPIIATRKTFMTGLTGAEGAVTDPVTGDYLFSTFGGGSRMLVVKGFALPLGAPCTDGVDCGSGFCADSVCCDSACNAGECDTCLLNAGAPENGTCTLLTGTVCDDGNGCSENDQCEMGECIGTAVQCPTAECVIDLGCKTESGMCETQNAADGTPCSVGLCIAGVCIADNAGGAGGTSQGGQGGTGGSAVAGSGGTAMGGTGGTSGNAGSGGGSSNENPGGCGCRSAPVSNTKTSLSLAALALVIYLRRRRLTIA
ncbi:MAG: hypothetical protein IPK82_02015 [Polyangiaceae bacterium]|nr:hypothetical protein [Polyangiaceae bacterium]